MTKKISQLNPAATLDGTELVELEQASASVQTTAQDIADLGGGGGLVPPLSQDDDAIIGESIVTGTVTAAEASSAIGSAHYGSSPAYLYSGAITAQAGNITGSDPAAGLYLYGARVLFSAGDVTISGNASVASRMAGGKVIIVGGSAVADAGERPARFKGGVASISGGEAVEAGVGIASGASIAMDGGGINVAGVSGGDLDMAAGGTTHPGADGGRALIRAGSGGAGGLNGEIMLVDSSNNRVIQVGPTDGTLGFYGQTPTAQQTGVAENAAAIHAALVALGLITA